MSLGRQPWLYSARADSAFLLAPAFLVTLLVLLFPRTFEASTTPPWAWLLLVVGIDVAHVYSTLYRTYFDRKSRERYRALLVLIPIGCWAGGMVLYSFGALVFWRVLAYLAVFHFIRQQYGFLRLYSRKEPRQAWQRRVDAAAIYLATVYPLVYWHTHPRKFHWFLAGDFLSVSYEWLSIVVGCTYVVALILYIGNAVLAYRRDGSVNLPKHLILTGSALSWYTGIVLYNGDLAFTVTNVGAHGVPYLALVWMYQRKQGEPSAWFRVSMIPAYLGLLLGLSYFEEAFWDVLVWRDHTQFFSWLNHLPQLEDHSALSVVVPLLAVPQAAHYVLDAFLWRVRDVQSAILR